MNKQPDLFDFSNYDKDHKCYSTKNKKVIGNFKDECGGLIINEFVGLRAKFYSYKMDKDKSDITKEAIKKFIEITEEVIKNYNEIIEETIKEIEKLEEHKSENKKCKRITKAVLKKITCKL